MTPEVRPAQRAPSLARACVLHTSFCMAMLLAPPLALAEEPRVGVVDSGRALAGSREGQGVEKSLQKLQGQRVEKLGPKTQKLRELRTSYEEKRLMMTGEAAGELELEIRKLERSLDRDVEEARDELEVERRRQLQPLLRNVAEAVKAIASERKLDVILEKSSPGVFFHAERVDITDAVIARMNARDSAKASAPAR
jgi:Skp family chaperone for outer membrane proteins